MMNTSVGRIQGKVAFITGGASGIGLGIAEWFIREGAKVMLFDLNSDLLSVAKDKFKEDCITAVGDVTKEGDLEKAVLQCADHFGHMDVGVNSAGLGAYAHITELTEEVWDTVIDICLKGVFLSMKHEARQMLATAKSGVIINIASLNSRQPAEGYAAYCSAKAGVEILTKVGAMELGPHKIRVCCISPGAVATPLTAGLRDWPSLQQDALDNTLLDRIGITDDIAAAALFLTSDEASWITGETLFVDGGSQTKRFPVLSDHISDLKVLMTQIPPEK